jgi:hypothetical protein
MRIKITRNTVADGHPVFVGDVVDAEDRTARYLIALGKATPQVVEVAPKKAAAAAPAEEKKATKKRSKKDD